eukprot:12026029-Ditylum_brightwellii.AAC.1
MHEEYVRKSEELFYGFYSPDGFTTFDLERSPTTWSCYSVDDDTHHCQDNNTNSEEEKVVMTNKKPFDIWNAMMEMEKRIIPAPFTKDELARVSSTPIISSEECDEIVHECENHYWGWGSSESRYGTPADKVGSMINLQDLSRSYSLVNFELLPRLFPAIISAFQSLKHTTVPENLRLAGSRVVKYDASQGRIELGLHRDGKLITANIALNHLNEYEGGGTLVQGLPNFRLNPIKMEKGH